MIEFGEGYYCDKGFFEPGQSVTTGGLESTLTGYTKKPVLIIRPEDCIEAEKIYLIECEQKMKRLAHIAGDSLSEIEVPWGMSDSGKPSDIHTENNYRKSLGFELL